MNDKSERVSIFIDGSNFYHSTSKKGRRVNFNKFIQKLSEGRDLVQAFYYVAPLDIEADEKKYWKHQRFLEILEQIPKFKVVRCSLKKLKSRDKDGGFIYLVKGDDVKLSNDLLMGAVEDRYDTAIVVSGDEDFIGTIKIVREKYGKKVGNAFFSRSSSSNLRDACDFAVNLNKTIDEFIDSKNIHQNKKKSSALPEDHTEH